MKLQLHQSMVLTAALVILVVAACGSPEPTQTTPAPTPIRVPQVAEPFPTQPPPRAQDFDLTETHALPGGFTIAYPAGWIAETNRGGDTVISATEEDHSEAFRRGYVGNLSDYQVTLFPGFIRWEERKDRAVRDVFLRWRVIFRTREHSLPVETQVFGVPAERVTLVINLNGRVFDCLMGFESHSIGRKRTFVFCLGASSDEELDFFKPTWDQMLASIERVQ